jgi:hypothetical protein
MEMSKYLDKRSVIIALGLTVLMLATRFHHFGSAISLPDASLAVFFVAGFYLRRIGYFVLFLLLAAGADYASISAGTSNYCLTPGYALLVPAYGSLWLCGLWFSRLYKMNWISLLPLVGTLLLGSLLAFLFSNAGFYFLSGYFEKMSLIEYTQRVMRYFGPYTVTAFAYTGLIMIAHIAGTLYNRQDTEIAE